MIYTLKYIKDQAEGIAGSWNGEDDRFNFEGDTYSEDDAHAATELLEKLAEVEELMKELNI